MKSSRVTTLRPLKIHIYLLIFDLFDMLLLLVVVVAY